MRSIISLSIVIVLTLSTQSWSQETLIRSEILEIVDQLIQQQRTTWIETGTLEVRHTEYRAPILTDPQEIEAKISQAIADFRSNPDKIVKTEELQTQALNAIPFNTRYMYANEASMTTYEVVRVDQDRHCQDITVESRTESVSKPASLAHNEMTGDFDLRGNRRRIFAWDGQNYTVYSLPTNNAIVDASNRFTQADVIALKAGLIPWGKGMFSKHNLVDAQITGQVTGSSEIVLNFVWATDHEFTCTLDPTKSFALTAYSVAKLDGFAETVRLSEHVRVNGTWIPHEVVRERYEAQAGRLLSFDMWEIISIDTETPPPGAFTPEYKEKAFVSFYSPLSGKPLGYHHRDRADTTDLLCSRLTVLASAGPLSQNCATLSLAYAAEKLGKPVPEQRLSGIVSASGYTSLTQMQSLAQSLGFNCRAVQTDIPGLAQYPGCRIILHLPEKDHCLVLDHMDDEDVWCVDLSSDRFYYPISIDRFGLLWAAGTALVLSARPIPVNDSVAVLTHPCASAIIAGAPAGTCTRVIQEENVEYCPPPPDCSGAFVYWFRIVQCEWDVNAPHACSNNIRKQSKLSIPCVYDLFGDTCVGSIWNFGHKWACEE